jgi:exopolysaccharide biosynthesis WecB/TagA/CpsF family protein
MTSTRISLGGCPVDLVERDDALAEISRRITTPDARALGVVSVNLDHIHHFGKGTGGAWKVDAEDEIDWLNLIDGAPLAAKATRMTGREWPRLAGSDLVGSILDLIERQDVSVGFLGGSPETHKLLRTSLAADRPNLRVSGYWAPSREELGDPARSHALALEIAALGTGVLIVCLGKPRQERWIAEYGSSTKVRVLLAFGAVVDFLAGRINRTPQSFADHGLEWAWRLYREPRRLARRYLVQGPPSMLRLLCSSGSLPPVPLPLANAPTTGQRGSVLIPAHNEGSVIERTLRPLAAMSSSGQIEVIVVCNGCTDGTAEIASRFSGVTVIEVDEPSKTTALNVGDHTAHLWPRIYLDADVEISPVAVVAVLTALDGGRALAARPIAFYDTSGAGFIVRCYYRARARIPSLHASLWGAGVYALSRAGHDRLVSFPAIAGDDFWVDQLFASSEKAIIDTVPVIVRTPRKVRALLGILRRGHRGVIDAIRADGEASPSTRRTLRELVSTIRGPRTAFDAGVFVALSLGGRFALARNGRSHWERDDTSR